MLKFILQALSLGLILSSCSDSGMMRTKSDKNDHNDSSPQSSMQANNNTESSQGTTNDSNNTDGADNINNTQGSSNTGGSSQAGVSELSDTSRQGIEAFLALNTFQNWDLQQDSPILTQAPHGEYTQTFINAAAEAALREGTQTMPVGSILVKIMYEQDQSTEFGRALMVKTSASGTNSWTWYEGFASGRSPFYGPGLGICASCHSAGTDFVSNALINDLGL